MIVYTDLMLASFVVVLLLASTMILDVSSSSYENSYSKLQHAEVTLYNLFEACSQEECLPTIQATFSSQGANITVSGSAMVVSVG